jgi:Flp pilus assembly pilin Flp
MKSRQRSRLARHAERGFTLLEYCAGAAIIAGLLWASFKILGTNLQGLLDALGTWVGNRAVEIKNQG